MEESGIINRVANSALVLIDLEEYYHPAERVLFDIKEYLFQELLLREKDFRAFVKSYDWSEMQGKNVAVNCSSDAIVPAWAYMLLSAAITPYAHKVVFGDLEDLEQALYQEALSKVDWEQYRDAKVVLKGCGKLPVPTFAYVEATRILRAIASSIMYGEPCSTVPVYKKPRNSN